MHGMGQKGPAKFLKTVNLLCLPQMLRHYRELEVSNCSGPAARAEDGRETVVHDWRTAPARSISSLVGHCC